MTTTPRRRLTLHLRSFPGWERLSGAVAAALDLPGDEVQALNAEMNPAVRLDAHAFVTGFQAAVDLFIDPLRAAVPPVASLAFALARQLEVDVAHHDGSENPYAYVLIRPTGQRLAACELVDDSDGLHLDESDGALQPLPEV